MSGSVKVYAIHLLFKLSVIALTYANLANAQWSQYPACSNQYENDRVACNAITGTKKTIATKKAKCWASASERLAYCNRTKGITGNPKLLK